MSGFVLRRSLVSLSALTALLLALGSVLVIAGAPPAVPLVLAVLIVGVQYLVNPWIVQWLVPADVVPFDGNQYRTDHALGGIVARRCADADIRPVKLGIVDDGTPNAFTFGRTQSDARIWVTRGLLERLDEAELDAVIAHEIGHIKNRDFIVMTLAGVVPVVAYFVYLGARGSRRTDSIPVAVGAYLTYLVSQLVVLSLSRARELGADHHSCAVTGNGDALCAALVKIGYGMGEVAADRKAQIALMKEKAKGYDGKERRQRNKEALKAEARANRVQAMGVMGIADHRQSDAMVVAVERGLEPDEVLGALRWEACSPWAKAEELLSSHPIIVHRIAALETSGLPGAPKAWGAARLAASCAGEDLDRARRRFPAELLIRFVGPTAALVALFAYYTDAWALLGWSMLASGVGFLVLALMQRPVGGHEAVDRITSLLGRLDASPVSAVPVSLRGRIIGRGMPGYVLSPDLVIQDGSGFVPLLYRQPLPFARSLFGLFKAERYQDQEVMVRGWYRRGPGPFVELRDVVAADGTRTRSWWWAAVLAGSTLLAIVGAATTLAQAG